MAKYKAFTAVLLSADKKVPKFHTPAYMQCKLQTGSWISFMNNHPTLHLIRYQMNAIGIPADHLTLEEILALCVTAHIPLDFEWYIYTHKDELYGCKWTGSVRLARIPTDG